MTIAIIYLTWKQLTFSNVTELVVFFPFLIYYFSRSKYDALIEDGLNISYYAYELSIFIFLLIVDSILFIKVYFEYLYNSGMIK